MNSGRIDGTSSYTSHVLVFRMMHSHPADDSGSVIRLGEDRRMCRSSKMHSEAGRS